TVGETRPEEPGVLIVPTEHGFMIWFRSANSHTGPQLHCCIRGRTDGSIRLRANALQKPLAFPGASTDEYTRLNPRTICLDAPRARDPKPFICAFIAMALRLRADRGLFRV